MEVGMDARWAVYNKASKWSDLLNFRANYQCTPGAGRCPLTASTRKRSRACASGVVWHKYNFWSAYQEQRREKPISQATGERPGPSGERRAAGWHFTIGCR